MPRCLQFVYEAPNQTMPNQIALNQTMLSQTKACITKLSCIDKRKNRAWLKLTDTIFFFFFFFGLSPSFNCLKKHGVSEASSVPVFRQRSP
jgi:hypothetical protein